MSAPATDHTSLIEDVERPNEPDLGEDTQELRAGPRPSFLHAVVLAATAGGVAAFVLAGVIGSLRPHPQAKQAKVGSSTELFAGSQFIGAVADGVTMSSNLEADFEGAYHNFKETYHTLHKPQEEMEEELKHHWTSPEPPKMSNWTYHDLLPKEKKHDGNLCPDDEEEMAGLCFKRCKDITNGDFPIRTTAWSCCMEEPCSFFNSKFSNPLFPCTGLAVAGAEEGNGCPHLPGDCLADEEFGLGVCYKKCAILTNNTYPYRSAAASCCRYPNHLACLDPVNLLTNASYAVGGGGGDGHESTPSDPHTPMPTLTESRRI